MKRFVALLCIALLGHSCADFPRDPEGTLSRVRSEGSFRLGLIAPLRHDGSGPEVAAFLHRLSAAASAEPAVVTGDAEPLLSKLKEGQLDIVIGRFEKKSPWATLVSIGPPLRRLKQGNTEFHLAPAMRNGENAWIAIVEAEARGSGANVQ